MVTVRFIYVDCLCRLPSESRKDMKYEGKFLSWEAFFLPALFCYKLEEQCVSKCYDSAGAGICSNKFKDIKSTKYQELS